jgi:hypothetical protein
LTITVSDHAKVRDEPPEIVVSPPPELLDTHVFMLKWQRRDRQDRIWMVQAYDGEGQLIGMGLGDSRDDALLELAEHLVPPDDQA